VVHFANSRSNMTDDFHKTFASILAVVVLCFAIYVLGRPDEFIERNQAWARWWYRQTKFPLYKLQAERLGSDYARAWNKVLAIVAIALAVCVLLNTVLGLNVLGYIQA
jgi:hypothetical protein